MPSTMEPRLVEAPGGGLVYNVNPRHVPDQAWANGRNVRFITGGSRIQSTDGFSKVDETQPGEGLRAIWHYQSIDGSVSTLVRIGTHSAWQGMGPTRTPIFDPLPVWNRTLYDVVTMDQYKDDLIWSDGLTIYKWNGVGASAIPATGPSMPTGTLIEIHKQHLLIGNLTAPIKQPWRVAYSGADAIYDFEDETAGLQDFLEDSSGLTAMKVLGDHVIVHKSNRLYRLIYVGPPNMYQAEMIPGDDGANAARSAISVGAYQFYMGKANFYRLASFSEPIGDAVWTEIERQIDWARAAQIYAYRRHEYDEICWKIPVKPSGVITAAYNFRGLTWTITDHDPGTCFAELLSEILPTTIETPHSTPARGVFGQENGNLYVYGGKTADGLAIHAWAESKHFTDGLTPAKILAVPCFATGEGTLQVSCRATMDERQPMPAWNGAMPLALAPVQTRPWVDVRRYGRLWQIRLESNAVDTEWEVPTYGAAVIPGGYAR